MLNKEEFYILHTKTDLQVISEEPYTGNKKIRFDMIKTLTSSKFINSIQKALTPKVKKSIQHISAEQEVWEDKLAVKVFIKTDETYFVFMYIRDSSNSSETINLNTFNVGVAERMNVINAEGLSLSTE